MTAKKIRPPVKWHGGKYYLASRIIELFPEHHVYVEPFAGSASVLLNKPVSAVEAYNDYDGRIVRIYRVIRDHGKEFVRRLELTPYAEAEFASAVKSDLGPVVVSDVLDVREDDIELARLDFLRWRQSFGGQGRTWSYSTTRSRGGKADNVNAWITAIGGLKDVIDRLRNVELFCRPAAEIIRRFDANNVLFYCDPPYVHSTRVSRDVYGVEMSNAGHEELAAVLKECTGNVILSGYQSPLYERLYKGWRRVEFDMPNHAAGGKTKRRQIECLWMNFE